MSTSNKKALLYLDADRLYFYRSDLPKTLKYSYSKNAVADLEIIDQERLKEDISKILAGEKIKPCHLFIILAKDVTFHKTIPIGSHESTRVEFESSMPFENVVSRLYEEKDRSILVATNKSFYHEFQAIFSHHGYVIDAIVPEKMFSKNIKGFAPSDKVHNDLLISSLANLINLDINNAPIKKEPKIKKIAEKQFTTNKNLRTLLLFFSIALLILAGAFLFAGSRPSPNSSLAKPLTSTPTPQTVNPEDPATINVEIFFSVRQEKTAKEIQNSYWSAGFKNTDIFATSSAVSRNIISLSSELSPSLIQKIKTEFEKFEKSYDLVQSGTKNTEVNIYLAVPR